FLGETDLPGHIAPGQALAFSADGTQLASGAEDGTVRVWALGADRPNRYTPFAPGQTTSLVMSDKAFSADGKVFVGHYYQDKASRGVWARGAPPPKRKASVAGQFGGHQEYAVSPDGKTLILHQKTAPTSSLLDVTVVDLTTDPPTVRQTLISRS